MSFFSLLQRSLSEILHGIQGVCCNKFKTKHQDARNAAITISLQLREVKLSSSSSVIPSIAPTPIPVFLVSSCHHHLTAAQSTAPAVERGQTVSSSSLPVTFPPSHLDCPHSYSRLFPASSSLRDAPPSLAKPLCTRLACSPFHCGIAVTCARLFGNDCTPSIPQTLLGATKVKQT